MTEWKIVNDSTECGEKEFVCGHDENIGEYGYYRCGILKDYCQESTCPLRVLTFTLAKRKKLEVEYK